MEKRYDIVCVGQIAQDLLVQPVDKGIFDVETTRIKEIKVLPGGDAMNESIVIARLGRKVALLGKVGDDQFGELVLKQARESGVDVENVKIDKTTVTTTSIVLINSNSERNFVYCAGNNEALCLDDVNLDAVRNAKIVNIGSILGLASLDTNGGTEAVLKEARAYNAITTADSTFDINDMGLEGIKGILKQLDFFIPSFAEASYLTGEEEPEKIADVFLGCGVRNVVVKLGKRGCFIKNSTQKTTVPPFTVNAADTTGAGDNFVAGFLTGLSLGWELERCGRFANATGAVSTLEVGANSGVKSMGQVLDFMKKYAVK